MRLTTVQLIGKIPESLGSLTNLQFLAINRNKFQSSLPESICKMSSLVDFEAQDAFLTGTLPDCFGMLSKANIVMMSSNQLQGLFQGLRDASINYVLFDFSGTIPSMWVSKALWKLDLSKTINNARTTKLTSHAYLRCWCSSNREWSDQ